MMPPGNKGLVLPRSFYLRKDVIGIARDLLGKVLHTNFNNILTSGIIVETEAYNGFHDRASHAFGGRKTKRTEPMFREGGIAYVYLCYGIHSLFNVVTNLSETPQAVLIRAIVPLDGLENMLIRSGKPKADKLFGVGPGKVSRILGIHYSHSGLPITNENANIWIEDRNIEVKSNSIQASPRIGVDYAGQDATLSYRFVLKSV